MICAQIAYRAQMDPHDVMCWTIPAILAYQRRLAEIVKAEDGN